MLFIEGKDMGLDSKAGTHSGLGRDVAGFSLSYFKDDYIPIGNLKFIANIGASGGFGNSSPSLYNGNIRRATYSLAKLSLNTIGYSYRYDQLNRLTQMNAWTNFNNGSYAWPGSGSASNKYKERITYDANGNILSYLRNAESPISMDSITYNYYSNTNKLEWVDDTVSTSNYTVDIDDQSSGNYAYDPTGNLIQDNAEEIETITWTLIGKVDSIKRSALSTKTNLKFYYDAFGNRVGKVVYDGSDITKTWYVRDAQGNIMATYTEENDTLVWTEQHLYGSSRLGYWQPDSIMFPKPSLVVTDTFRYHIKAGDKRFEFTNHLGNVLAVFTDRKIGIDTNADTIANYYEPDISSIQDYYPFGMLTPGRNWSAGSEYRFGFNGQEQVDEVYGNGNLNTAMFWEYDTRLGRRWNVDPVVVHWESSYVTFSGSPITKTDINGDNADWVEKKDGSIAWDDNANSQSSTKEGETYLGKNLTFTFNSTIDAGLWDGPGGSSPAGDKLTSTLSLSASENSKGQLTGLNATSSVKIGDTPFGTARDYFPGLGSNQNKFTFSQSSNADGTLGGFSLNFEQHASVSPIEQLGLKVMGYDIVNVAQGISLNYSSSKLSISAATDVFPSASLAVNGIQLFQYDQPSFKATHGRNSSFIDNGMGGVELETTPRRPAPSLIKRYSK